MRTLFVSASRAGIETVNDLPLVKSLFNPSKLETRMLTWIPIPVPFKDDKVFTAYEPRIDADILLFLENKKGLSYVYNKVIDSLDVAASKIHGYECVIFIHDDVSIEHPAPIKIIKEYFKEGNTIVGLAGASTYKLQEPALWHLASDQNSWSGAVSHPYNEHQLCMTSFGPVPRRCLVMDGLFLAVDVKALQQGLRFDEQFTFHFYDIDFCLSANEKKLKMTTAPIWCTHRSPGLENANDNTFVVSQEKFLKKWKNTFIK